MNSDKRYWIVTTRNRQVMSTHHVSAPTEQAATFLGNLIAREMNREDMSSRLIGVRPFESKDFFEVLKTLEGDELVEAKKLYAEATIAKEDQSEPTKKQTSRTRGGSAKSTGTDTPKK